MQVALFWEMLHILEFVPHGKKNYDRHHRLEAFIHKVIRRRNFTYVTMSKRKKIRGRKKSRKVIATSCKSIPFRFAYLFTYSVFTREEYGIKLFEV